MQTSPGRRGGLCPRCPFTKLLDATAAILLATVVSSLAAYAGKSWKPRFQPKQGSVQHFAVSNDLTVRADIPLVGRRSGHLDLRIELRQRVVERRRRGPTTLQLIYDRILLDGAFGERVIRYDTAEPTPGAARDDLDRLIGRSVTLVVSPRGEIIDVRSLDDPPASHESAALLDALAQRLEREVLKAVYQQASPVFPGNRIRVGDSWNAELTLPDPAFGTMRIESEYEVLGTGRLERHRYIKTRVRSQVELTGRGPLLDHLGSLVGAEGEVRVRGESGLASSTIWTERKNGVALGLLGEQQLVLRVSLPMKILGFTQRVELPVKLEQKIAVERME